MKSAMELNTVPALVRHFPQNQMSNYCFLSQALRHFPASLGQWMWKLGMPPSHPCPCPLPFILAISVINSSLSSFLQAGIMGMLQNAFKGWHRERMPPYIHEQALKLYSTYHGENKHGFESSSRNSVLYLLCDFEQLSKLLWSFPYLKKIYFINFSEN